MKWNISLKIFSAGLVLGLAACASQTRLESDLGISGAPDWVNKGTAYVNDKDGRLFHGVGSASAMGDPALQRSTADDRARAEVARIFSAYMDVVQNDYQAAAKSGDQSNSEESVTRQIKAVTKQNLAGAQIIARWVDKKTNTVWSIAELDAKHVKMTIANSSDMNEGAKRFFESNADNVFDRIAKEKK